jgi:cell division protein FtsI/penicillin-binding protein 2
VGQYGLEAFFNDDLNGKNGSVKAERAANGQLIIVNDREYQKAQNGSDLVLTINRPIQFMACQKLKDAVIKHGAESGSVIVMNPKSGAILAMCSWPDYNPNEYKEVDDIKVYNNPAIFEQYEPGSVFKAVTMAAGLDLGLVNPRTTYNDTGRVVIEKWPISNSDYESFGAHGTTDMVTVLEKSLNTGAIFVAQKVGGEKYTEYIKNFGFGEKTGIELETESSGDIRNLSGKKTRQINLATASFGQGITVTPLQMITSYAAIANGGFLMKPYVVGEIKMPSGEKKTTSPQQLRRVISDSTSALLSGMLVNAVEQGHAQKAQVKGYFVGGKTGTAQVANSDKKGYSTNTIHSFIGFAPRNDPKFVMLTKLNYPKARFAETTAVPLFGEIAEFILNYYKVPKERSE